MADIICHLIHAHICVPCFHPSLNIIFGEPFHNSSIAWYLVFICSAFFPSVIVATSVYLFISSCFIFVWSSISLAPLSASYLLLWALVAISFALSSAFHLSFSVLISFDLFSPSNVFVSAYNFCTSHCWCL